MITTFLQTPEYQRSMLRRLLAGAKVLAAMVSIVVFTARCATAQEVIAPVAQQEFRHLTSYATLREFVYRLASQPGFRVLSVGNTQEHRDVMGLMVSTSQEFLGDSLKIRVLLFAQQHGNEPSGKEALTLLLASIARGEQEALLRKLDLFVIPQMNPDGAEKAVRRNAENLDLNRSHFLLNAPEVAGMHEAAGEFRPEVTLDIHEYMSGGAEWDSAGFYKTTDVQLGLITNINAPAAIRAYEQTSVFPYVEKVMKDAGYSCTEYLVGTPDFRLRHSTTEINDGRMSFGILGSLSFIQEGRRWGGVEDTLARRTKAQLTSVLALLRFVADHTREIRAMVRNSRAELSHRVGKMFYPRMDHRWLGGVMTIPVKSTRTGLASMWNVHPYHDAVVPLDSVPLPSAYVVPCSLTAVIDLLRKHDVAMTVAARETKVSAESWWLESQGNAVIEEETLVAPLMSRHPEVAVIHTGDCVVSTSNEASMFIASALEPTSYWGVMKYPGKFGELFEGKKYRIFRIP